MRGENNFERITVGSADQIGSHIIVCRWRVRSVAGVGWVSRVMRTSNHGLRYCLCNKGYKGRLGTRMCSGKKNRAMACRYTGWDCQVKVIRSAECAREG